MSPTAQAIMPHLNLVFALSAYCIGSLSFAVIISKLMGIADPRHYGSKNPGATNVLRSGNKKAAALTLLCDALKGLAIVWLARVFGLGADGVAWTALAVVLGHMWPIFFGFKGGKGVATAIGVMFGLSGLLGLAVVLSWLLVAFLTRYSSLAAILSLAMAPVYAWFLQAPGSAEKGITIVIAMLVFMRHRQNVIKLLSGQEKKIGEKASSLSDVGT